MDTEEILDLKPIADEIMSISGNTKGNSLYTDMQFILERKGEEGLEALEEALSVLGYPFSYKDVKGFEWYPESQAVLGIFLAKKIFGWSEEEIFDMGFAAPTSSLLVKTIMRFISLERTFEQGPSVWKKHYDFGKFEPLEINSSEKYLKFRVSGYGFFDYMEAYFEGFFTRLLQLLGIADLESLEGKPCKEDAHNCRDYDVRWK
ncbi:MAG: hypothetical protein U5L75_01785 [Candidatus Campbellbacteria bacterium]|nr:hypothetical protein [Candidatus Campbellbacteria bacterium]